MNSNYKLIIAVALVLITLLSLVSVYQFYLKNDSNSSISYQHAELDVELPPYTLSKRSYYRMLPNYNVETTLPSRNIDDLSTDYPKYSPLGKILENWFPNDTSADHWKLSSYHPSQPKSIYRLNYQNASEMEIALALRDRDLPYILYNVPELDQAAKTEFTLASLVKHFGKVPRIVEKSISNEFLYYTMKNPLIISRNYPEWKPPQQDHFMTFKSFLNEAAIAERAGDIAGNSSLHYLTISASEGGRTKWIRASLPFFEPKESLFMKEPDKYRGVNCRFGMKGVIAAPHYDSRRNYIAMIRGRKRYIILPPRECNKLQLYPRGHPSARHSQVRWSDIEEVKKYPDLYNADAFEVVLSMGEIMFLPSFWFHYIISQDASIQCNARSGEAISGKSDIEQCGFMRKEKSPEKSQLRTREERRKERLNQFEWQFEN